MNSEYEGTLRQILQFIGAFIVGHGVLTAADWQMYSGLIISLTTVGWSVYRNRQARLRSQAAVEVAEEAVSSSATVPIHAAPQVVEQKILEAIKAGPK